ncbi:MAG: hypothetical protein ACP5I1_18520 [Candidatus Hinthialibacter sp.]
MNEKLWVDAILQGDTQKKKFDKDRENFNFLTCLSSSTRYNQVQIIALNFDRFHQRNHQDKKNSQN